MFVLLALILIFAGCKAESPTTPTVTTPGGTPTGGVTPPTNATIDLTVSNANPLVNSNVVVTATVKQNGQNVPNGTAVQFTTTLGTFTDTGTQSTIRTTTNGVATATLTSAAAGTATITAVVTNVSKSITVTFSSQPVIPPPPSTNPTITNITPTTGRPEGGEVITISGTNFIGPVRVLFDLGNGTVKEAFVNSFTNNQIIAVTPRIDLGTGQTKAVDVIVITQAGTAAEQRVTKSQGFTYQAAVLTPAILSLQPTSGPIGGGTRVTIFGDAFQQPVQVFFGAAEAEVISVIFHQIIVMSPRASDTASNGSGVVVGPVNITVKNIGSGTSTTMTGGFRYIPKMQITTAGPTSGPFTGGTRITIDGTGFDDPLAVDIGTGTTGVAAQVISVSGTEVVAITPAIQPTGCTDVTGVITVTNTENGDQATGPSFTFRVPKPLIISITPNPATLGGTTNITVLNAFGFARITIGGLAVNITGSTVNADGTTTFAVTVPLNLPLTTISCTAGGAAPQPTQFDVTYTSATTACTDTSPKGLTVNPAAAPVLFLNPSVFQLFTATITPANPLAIPPTLASVTPSAPQTMNIVNTGTQPLTVNSITAADVNPGACSRFTLSLPFTPSTLNQCEAAPIIARYNGQTTAITDQCRVTIDSNAGIKVVSLTGTSQ